MRPALTLVCSVLAVAVTVASGGDARADKGDAVLGTYEVRYEEVSSNCSQTSISLGRGRLEVTKKGKQIVVDIQRFPLMYGTPGRAGKLRASSKQSRSSIEGVDTKVSVAGRVDEGLIQLVFVAEYFVKNKPLCTQTWNVSGKRKEGAAKGKAAALDADATAMLDFDDVDVVRLVDDRRARRDRRVALPAD
jgi:hypothetical protein